MSGHPRDTDQALERVLRWRADRARPIGLLADIHQRIEMETPPRTRAWWSFASASGRLAWLLVVFALLAALAAGVALTGARLQLSAVAVTPPPSDPVAGLKVVYCDRARSLPFASSGVALTGAWTDQNLVYYFRQDGRTLWGEATFAAGRLEAMSTDLATYHPTVFHGTVAGDGTIRLDWSDLGAVDATDRSTALGTSGGTIVLRLEGDAHGNTQMVSVSQSGAAYSGPGFSSSLLFSPCTPAYQP